ncbi:hypothetical protein C8Q75DRAFT_271067 [Abortiporus biennis]|nr:hypothetical protein C8Q75DRAFT_271067 [Abortiporus biennis]
MSTVIDVSPKLGQYMLKGWVLTDDICPKCKKIPLMRSPSGPVVYFCANCDSESSTKENQDIHVGSSNTSNSSLDSNSHGSRPSTPPTEVSSTLSSPAFAPVDTEEILRRRQQSDRASNEIGSRLLKGWAMLADECPNSTCYGIPLVRPPKTGSERDPHKECVICHRVYVDQASENGVTRLVSIEPDAQPSTVPGITAKRDISADSTASSSAVPQVKLTSPTTTLNYNIPVYQGSHTPPSTLVHLQRSAETLETSLVVLTEKLNTLSKGPNVDPSYIGQTADAINKVAQALMNVKQLHWSESQAYLS